MWKVSRNSNDDRIISIYVSNKINTCSPIQWLIESSDVRSFGGLYAWVASRLSRHLSGTPFAKIKHTQPVWEVFPVCHFVSRLLCSITKTHFWKWLELILAKNYSDAKKSNIDLFVYYHVIFISLWYPMMMGVWFWPLWRTDGTWNQQPKKTKQHSEFFRFPRPRASVSYWSNCL